MAIFIKAILTLLTKTRKSLLRVDVFIVELLLKLKVLDNNLNFSKIYYSYFMVCLPKWI